jgi:hypothetical protein
MWYLQYHRTWVWLCHSLILILLFTLAGSEENLTNLLRRNGGAYLLRTGRAGGLMLRVTTLILDCVSQHAVRIYPREMTSKILKTNVSDCYASSFAQPGKGKVFSWLKKDGLNQSQIEKWKLSQNHLSTVKKNEAEWKDTTKANCKTIKSVINKNREQMARHISFSDVDRRKIYGENSFQEIATPSGLRTRSRKRGRNRL